MKVMNRWTWICVAALLSAGGCTGYRLGTTLPAELRSVFVPTFSNQSNEPQVEIVSTQETIREFQRDGTMTILEERQAATMVRGTIISYELVPIRYDRDDAKSVEQYRIILTARIEFLRSGTNEVLMDTTVQGDTTFPVAGDLPSAKRAALPDAANSLARRVVSTVISCW